MLKDNNGRTMLFDSRRNSGEHGKLVAFHIDLDHVGRTCRSQQSMEIDEFCRLPLAYLGYVGHAKIAVHANYAAISHPIADCRLKDRRTGQAELGDVLTQYLRDIDQRLDGQNPGSRHARQKGARYISNIRPDVPEAGAWSRELNQGVNHTAIESPGEVNVSAYEVIGQHLDIESIGGVHIKGSLGKSQPAQGRTIDDASLSVVER